MALNAHGDLLEKVKWPCDFLEAADGKNLCKKEDRCLHQYIVMAEGPAKRYCTYGLPFGEWAEVIL